MTRALRLAAATALVASVAGPAAAQVRSAQKPVPPDLPAFSVRVFGDAGVDSLSASRSFNAVFGRDNAPLFGGGGEGVLRAGWFFRVGLWRIKEVGERAVRLENQTFRLGIPLTVTIVPVEVSGGYRFRFGPRSRLVPYVGGGVSSHSYKETSSFSVGEENVSERFTGYQILGGAEYRLHRMFAVAGEVQYTTVPDALGLGGLSEEFDETDLGGVILRVRVLFGR
jgi:opacity protein-like surface antigen